MKTSTQEWMFCVLILFVLYLAVGLCIYSYFLQGKTSLMMAEPDTEHANLHPKDIRLY